MLDRNKRNTQLYYLTITLFVLTLSFNSCKRDFSNKKLYEIQVGQTFDLYIGENSCCINCWLNENSLKSIKLIEQKLIDPADKDCDGCTSYSAWTFKGTKLGNDTIKIARLTGGMSCIEYKDSSNFEKDIFIVTVKK